MAEGVEDLEFWVTVMRIQEEGATVRRASARTPTRTAARTAWPCAPRPRPPPVDAAALDGLVIPGGWAPDKMRRDPDILALVRDVHERGLPIGDHLPRRQRRDLGRHRRRRGRPARSASRTTSSTPGAEWVDEPAFRDGNLVWGRVVADIPDFSRELIALLVEAAGS